ncbi:hypothetical protein B0T26DRAFT_713435, partial [Lasiosphaeria miniovina]
LRGANYAKDFSAARVDFGSYRGKIVKSKATENIATTDHKDYPWRDVAKVLISNNRKWTFELRPKHTSCHGTAHFGPSKPINRDTSHENHPPIERDFNKLKLRVVFGPEYKAFIASYINRLAIPDC